MAAEQPKNKEVKRRKIRQSDWRKVEEFLKKELQKRKDSNFRKSAETKWAEIDRQIAMEPMKKLLPGGKEAPQTWESAFELGELSKASEVIAADVMRLIFPLTAHGWSAM
jgi:type III secretory pathway component EscR